MKIGRRRSAGSPSGSDRTRRFYDETGWTENGGLLVDLELFGTKEDGPIRIELHDAHQHRVHTAIAEAGSGIELLECGCGGSPEVSLLDLCTTYVGVDFSETGLKRADATLRSQAVPYELHLADVCDLPFDDASFDAVYSAHMIYHIPDRDAQARALDEMLRVTKPGGVLVLIVANPFPLLFPGRSLKRIVARTPVVGPVADRIRPDPPLPYEPLSPMWLRRRVGTRATVETISNGLPTTAFNQRVSEFKPLGRLLWQSLRWIDLTAPRASVFLGNYVQLTATKR